MEDVEYLCRVVIETPFSGLSIAQRHLPGKTKPDRKISLRYFGNPAVSGRPFGFPSHSREWFSIIDYHG
jgi:hypothetical protein